MVASDHRKALAAAEDRSARNGRHSLLARVDQVSVRLAGLGVRAHAQQTILALELDVDSWGEIVGGEGGDADAEVDVHAVRKLLCGPPSDLLAGLGALIRLAALPDSKASAGASVLRQPFDALLVGGPLDDAGNVDSRKMDFRGVEGAGGDDLLHLGDADLGGLGHVGVEVPGGALEHDVAAGVRLPPFDQGEVPRDALLQDVAAAVVRARLPGRGRDLNLLAAGLVLDGEAACGDKRDATSNTRGDRGECGKREREGEGAAKTSQQSATRAILLPYRPKPWHTETEHR